MIRYWIPVRLLAYDVPHRIRSIDVQRVIREGQRRKPGIPAWAVLVFLMLFVIIAIEFKAALGAR